MVKLFVGGLPEGVDSIRLRQLFSQFVIVNECDVIKDYAFVVSHYSSFEIAVFYFLASNSVREFIIHVGCLWDGLDESRFLYGTFALNDHHIFNFV